MLPSLLVISDSTQTDNITDTLKHCIDMGAEFIGIREYTMNDSAISQLLEDILKYSQNTGTLISIWNNPQLAEDYALGLHMSATTYKDTFKQRLDYDSPLGKSCHTPTEIASAKMADYITVSPVYNSISKTGHNGIGIDTFKNMLGYARQPVFALGGIHTTNVEEILETDTYGVALCGTAMQNPTNIKKVLKNL